MATVIEVFFNRIQHIRAYVLHKCYIVFIIIQYVRKNYDRKTISVTTLFSRRIFYKLPFHFTTTSHYIVSSKMVVCPSTIHTLKYTFPCFIAWTYHTLFDTIDSLPLGSVSHTREIKFCLTYCLWAYIKLLKIINNVNRTYIYIYFYYFLSIVCRVRRH